MKRLPATFYNPIGMAGAAVALVSFCVIAFLLLIDFFSVGTSPYLGIVTFILLPGFLVLGLILIPIGMKREKRRMEAQPGVKPRSFYLDLDKDSHRRATLIFLIGSVIFLLATAVGSYRAYEFTESVTFCGEICHTIMEPEFVAYQKSPHARVTCAECHVGEGAGWFVQSKLSGSYQVIAALFDLYPRPIPTPIHNLRPARETCEQCHWPNKFHGSREKVFDHFKVDEENSEWPIRMLIKTGGGDRENGKAEGIHWHLNLDNKIEFIAVDDRRQNIPWVRVRNKDGNEKIYVTENDPIPEEEIANYEIREMSCIDCHNRPSHVYETPSRSVNEALASGQISRTLPSAKRIAIESLIAEYETTEQALTTISGTIMASYKDEFPEIAEGRAMGIDSLISATQKIYRQNFFPRMKVRWDAYPDNIGHFSSPGCYRCHDGQHVSEDGSTITNDCRNCHVILAQGPDQAVSDRPEGWEFKHPEDIGEAWKEITCSECHTGTSQL